MPPGSESYRAVAPSDDGVVVASGDSPCGESFGDDGIVAAQSPDLERAQAERELRGKERSFRLKFLLAGGLLVAGAFGGHEYYVRNYGDGGVSKGALFASGGRMRGGVPSTSAGTSADESMDVAEDGDEAFGVMTLVEGGDDEGGVEEFEGDLDDEIINGEAEGEIVDYDDVIEDDDISAGEVGEEKEEDYLGGLGDPYDEDAVDPSDTKEVEDSPAEPAVPKGGFIADDYDVPDYFVPLSPNERTALKERLRKTVRLTRDSLLQESTGRERAAQPQRTLVLSEDAPKQFMHMHHMKTGGTSVDGLIRCALQRQKDVHGDTPINYGRMSECGSTVRTCMSDLAKKLDASVVENVFYRNDDEGRPILTAESSFDPADENLGVHDLNVCKTSESSVMSYCASLHAVRTFGWTDVDKVTMIRDPVDRAWSMYRFSLQGCYKCEEMKDVLRKVENGTFVGRGAAPRSPKGKGENPHEPGAEHLKRVDPHFAYDPNDSCAVQMIGHQATNLLSSVELYNVANDVRFPREAEIAAEAVRNLREGFTWIGITDRIAESIEGFRTVFPFLSENLNDAASAFGEALGTDNPLSLPGDYEDTKGCPFEHRNAGRDPKCGTKEMDEETIQLIKKLSARDTAVYQAAVERFELQQEVLEEFWNGTL